MKRTILVALIAVMVATPCLAQEIEPDGMFSIEGTLWRFGPIINCTISPLLLLPFFAIEEHTYTMVFHQGKVYWCNETECRNDNNYTYINTPVLSVAYYNSQRLQQLDLMVMQPTGFGLVTGYRRTKGGYALELYIGIMFKVDNDWSPYDQTIRCGTSTDSCPDDMICVDNPNDGCDPNDYNCPGVCVYE